MKDNKIRAWNYGSNSNKEKVFIVFVKGVKVKHESGAHGLNMNQGPGRQYAFEVGISNIPLDNRDKFD